MQIPPQLGGQCSTTEIEFCNFLSNRSCSNYLPGNSGKLNLDVTCEFLMRFSSEVSQVYRSFKNRRKNLFRVASIDYLYSSFVE